MTPSEGLVFWWFNRSAFHRDGMELDVLFGVDRFQR